MTSPCALSKIFGHKIHFVSFSAVIGLLTVFLLIQWWAYSTYVTPTFLSRLETLASMYDDHFPTIIVRDARVSVEAADGFFQTGLRPGGIGVIMDCRATRMADRAAYLKDLAVALVLARDSLIMKAWDRQYIVGLPRIPNMTLNSESLQGILSDNRSLLSRRLPCLAIPFMLLSIAIQAGALSLAIYLPGRLVTQNLPLSGAFKMAVCAMIPLEIVHILAVMLTTNYWDVLMASFSAFVISWALGLVMIWKGRHLLRVRESEPRTGAEA